MPSGDAAAAIGAPAAPAPTVLQYKLGDNGGYSPLFEVLDVQTVTVPAGVTAAHIIAVGGWGGDAMKHNNDFQWGSVGAGGRPAQIDLRRCRGEPQASSSRYGVGECGWNGCRAGSLQGRDWGGLRMNGANATQKSGIGGGGGGATAVIYNGVTVIPAAGGGGGGTNGGGWAGGAGGNGGSAAGTGANGDGKGVGRGAGGAGGAGDVAGVGTAGSHNAGDGGNGGGGVKSGAGGSGGTWGGGGGGGGGGGAGSSAVAAPLTKATIGTASTRSDANQGCGMVTFVWT